jgi:hypothetical protein
LDLLEQRVVVLEEELQELLLMAPLALVVVLDCVWLIGATLRGRTLRQQRSCKRSGDAGDEDGENESAHKASTEVMVVIVPWRLYALPWKRNLVT